MYPMDLAVFIAPLVVFGPDNMQYPQSQTSATNAGMTQTHCAHPGK